jgi:lipopolysaccharide heptosyltransferase I
MNPDTKHILIIKPSALGDIVLALPALHALRTHFRQAHIAWLVRPEFAPLLQNHPELNEVILFDRKNLKTPGQILALIRTLQSHRFDLIFDFQGLFRSAFLAWVSGSPLRYGMAGARECAPWFYTHSVRPEANTLHLVDLYLKMARQAGASCDAAEFILPDTDADTRTAFDLLKKHTIDPAYYAVFIPGSAHDTKCWPHERFARLAEKLRTDYDLPVAAIGSASESSAIDQMALAATTPIINLAGRTHLQTLCALLRHAKLVVSNDTGPGHIASALGVPLVMLFSWSNPARIYPYARPECVAAINPFDRNPRIIKSRDPGHNVRHVSLDMVWDKVKQQMSDHIHQGT